MASGDGLADEVFGLVPEFCDEIPHELEHGKLYLAPQYRAAVHLCACGCGTKISTPLDGRTHGR